MIITDERVLRTPSEPVKSRAEGGEVARKLIAALDRHNKHARRLYARSWGKLPQQVGIGLSAIQIGLPKAVCVLKVRDVPLVLMNPVIVGHSEATIGFTEGCLSFPGEEVKTRRWLWVRLQTLNLGELTVGPTFPFNLKPADVLKSIAVQHEVDHISGILFRDRADQGEEKGVVCRVANDEETFEKLYQQEWVS